MRVTLKDGTTGFAPLAGSQAWPSDELTDQLVLPTTPWGGFSRPLLLKVLGATTLAELLDMLDTIAFEFRLHTPYLGLTDFAAYEFDCASASLTWAPGLY